MSLVKSCSFTKNLVPLTQLGPKPTITWDMHERIKRNKECWDNPDSIVHRLPKHYQQRYWRNFVLAKRTPVNYDPPEFRLYWDKDRRVELETEEYPILPEYCLEQDQGLWGGEGVIKGYKRSRPKLKKKILPRHWIPKFWFPKLKTMVLYSEILNKCMQIVVTERVSRLIDKHHGLDLYLLETADIDINSKLGMDLKRQILITLAKENYYPSSQGRREYIKAKYAPFTIPLEEAEWYGLDLNTACSKQQDLEDNGLASPLKYIFEKQLIRELEEGGLEKLSIKEELEEVKKPKEDDWGEWEDDWKEREENYKKTKWIGWRG